MTRATKIVHRNNFVRGNRTDASEIHARILAEHGSVSTSSGGLSFRAWIKRVDEHGRRQRCTGHSTRSVEEAMLNLEKNLKIGRWYNAVGMGVRVQKVGA